MDNLEALTFMRDTIEKFRRLEKPEREYLAAKLMEESKLENTSARLLEKLRAQYHADPNSYNSKIPYIREVRQISGLGLKEAKDLVESWLPF